MAAAGDAGGGFHSFDDAGDDSISVEIGILCDVSLDGSQRALRFCRPDDLHDRRKALRMAAWLWVRPLLISVMPASIFCRT